MFIKLREKRFITNEYTVMDMHLNFVFKRALHFSALVIKLFNSVTKLKLLPQHYELVFFETPRQPYDTPTFKT